MTERLTSYIGRFSRAKVVVLGDVMVDRYIRGEAERISPEAPVPVVRVTSETYAPGGAANVAANIAALAGEAVLVGITGKDIPGERLRHDLIARGIRTAFVTDEKRPTILKTRVIAGHQQVVRFDRESTAPLPAPLQDALLEQLKTAIAGGGALILSDYGKGCLTERLIGEAIGLARKAKKPVFVDPFPAHGRFYGQAFCLTPNLAEAAMLAGAEGKPSGDEETAEKLGAAIRRSIRCEYVLVTRGDRGMSLIGADGAVHIPARAREVFDVTGAGDTVAAVLAIACAAGVPIEAAAQLANLAAGVVVGKLGTATVSPAELLAAVRDSIPRAAAARDGERTKRK